MSFLFLCLIASNVYALLAFSTVAGNQLLIEGGLRDVAWRKQRIRDACDGCMRCLLQGALHRQFAVEGCIVYNARIF